jgi:type II secretory pathway component PulF
VQIIITLLVVSILSQYVIPVIKLMLEKSADFWDVITRQ